MLSVYFRLIISLCHLHLPLFHSSWSLLLHIFPDKRSLSPHLLRVIDLPLLSPTLTPSLTFPHPHHTLTLYCTAHSLPCTIYTICPPPPPPPLKSSTFFTVSFQPQTPFSYLSFPVFPHHYLPSLHHHHDHHHHHLISSKSPSASELAKTYGTIPSVMAGEEAKT